MFKKTKHKRSAWFEGLLEAERLIEKGFIKVCEESDNLDILKLWFKSPQGSYCVGIDCLQVEFCRGVLDYLEHKEKYFQNT